MSGHTILTHSCLTLPFQPDHIVDKDQYDGTKSGNLTCFQDTN